MEKTLLERCRGLDHGEPDGAAIGGKVQPDRGDREWRPVAIGDGVCGGSGLPRRRAWKREPRRQRRIAAGVIYRELDAIRCGSAQDVDHSHGRERVLQIVHRNGILAARQCAERIGINVNGA